jgi:uncharacterized protein with beta-barrel porin domain
MLTGSIRLAGTTNTVTNLGKGTLFAGAELNLGGGTLINHGILQTGGLVDGGMTVLTGNLQQSSTGSMHFLIGSDGKTGALAVTGLAKLSGTLSPAFSDPGKLVEGKFTHVNLISASGGLTLENFSTLKTAIIGTSMSVKNNALDYVTNVSFRPEGLSATRVQFGDAIARIQARGGTKLLSKIVTALVEVPTVAELEKVYGSLSGDAVTGVQQVALDNLHLATGLGSDRSDEWRRGSARPAVLGRRFWSMPLVAAGKVERTSGRQNSDTFGGAVGVDAQLSDDVLVGTTFVTGRTHISNTTRDMSGSMTFTGMGVYASAKDDNAYLSVSMFGGVDQSYMARRFAQVSDTGLAQSKFTGVSLSAKIEAGYSFGFRGISFAPYVALEPAVRWQDRGAESISFDTVNRETLSYQSQISRSVLAEYGVELSEVWQVGKKSFIDGYLRGGVRHELAITRQIQRSFELAPDIGFTSRGDFAEQNVASAKAGLAWRISTKFKLFAEGQGRLSSTGKAASGQAGVSLSW